MIIAADFAIIFLYQFFFFNVVNIIVTISYFFSLLLTLFLLRDNFNIVNRGVYRITMRVLCTLYITVSVLFLNMLYIIVFHGLNRIEIICEYFLKGNMKLFIYSIRTRIILYIYICFFDVFFAEHTYSDSDYIENDENKKKDI